MDECTNIILSIVTALTAIIAIIISFVQIIKNNKQALFERRLRAYLKIKWMKSLCDENKSIFNSYMCDLEEGPVKIMDLFFMSMTNVSYLEEIQECIKHVLEPDYQRKYLIKIEELRSLCEEVRMIFSENLCHTLADFIYYYEEMLVSIYKYQVVVNNISKYCIQNKLPFPDDNSLENSKRKEMIKYISGTFELAEKLDSSTLDKFRSKIKF